MDDWKHSKRRGIFLILSWIGLFVGIVTGILIEEITNSHDIGLVGFIISFFLYVLILGLLVIRRNTEDKRKMKEYIDKELNKK